MLKKRMILSSLNKGLNVVFLISVLIVKLKKKKKKSSEKMNLMVILYCNVGVGGCGMRKNKLDLRDK